MQPFWKEEGDGDSRYLRHEELLAVLGGWCGLSQSTASKSCVIWIYFLVLYCLFPPWEALFLSMETWMFCKYISVYFLKTILCTWSISVPAAGHWVVPQLGWSVEKGQYPRDCHKDSWPPGRLWDRVGAAVLRTKHAARSWGPFPGTPMSQHTSCSAAQPEEGTGHCRSLCHSCGKAAVLGFRVNSCWFWG